MLLPNEIATALRREGSTLVRIERRQLRSLFYECLELSTNNQCLFHESSLIPMRTIPSRFREALFAQLAEHIGKALDVFPSSLTIDPAPLSVDTMRRRLHEAISAKRLYGWKHHLVNEEKWKQNIDSIVVSVLPSGLVRLGPRPAKTKRIGSEVAVSAPSQETVGLIELTLQEPDEIETLCRLLHRKALNPLPIVLIRNITPEQATSLEARYDIAVVPHDDEPGLFMIMT